MINPPQRMASKLVVSAKIWYSGRAATILILLTSPMRSTAGKNQASACNVAATTLRCVRTAPFDKPVVPPVYCKNAIESKFAGLGLRFKPLPLAMATLKGVTCKPLDVSKLKAGTIFLILRTANVIHLPNTGPSKSPIVASTTRLIGVLSMICVKVVAKFSRMMMVSAPESLS